VLFETANNDHQFLGFGINNNILRYQVATTLDNHAFFAGTGAGASNELMRIQGSGNVGIGTAAPASRLHVTGDIRTNTIVHVGTNGAIFDGTNQGGSLELGGGNATAGVGTPFIDFHFNGLTQDFNMRLINLTNGQLCVLGGTLGATVVACSDERYKRDIRPMGSVLDRLADVQGVYYNYRTEEFPEHQFDTRLQIGVIAQQLEGEFPELVYTDANGYKSVEYAKLTPVLVQAVNELRSEYQQQIATLQQQNTQLQAQLAQIQQTVQALQTAQGTAMR
jgi:hypothetical protein